MTTKELIGQIRKSRIINKSHHINQIKKRIGEIRRELVRVSWQEVPDLDRHRELLKELKLAQAEFAETVNT